MEYLTRSAGKKSWPTSKGPPINTADRLERITGKENLIHLLLFLLAIMTSLI
jgi:hypothetical protein